MHPVSPMLLVRSVLSVVVCFYMLNLYSVSREIQFSGINLLE